MSVLRAIFLILRGLLQSRAALETLALRQQWATAKVTPNSRTGARIGRNV